MKRVICCLLLNGWASVASANVDIVVHIQCDTSEQTSYGSGVIVSETGRVLTAAHVLPDGAECTASIGSNNGDRLPITREAVAPDHDAAIAQLQTSRRFTTFARACPARRSEVVFSFGYHDVTEGAPSSYKGTISKAAPQLFNFDGFSTYAIEIDFDHLRGQSGGPVFIAGTTGLVGIVLGAKFDAFAGQSNWIVPVHDIAELGLSRAATCQAKDSFGQLADELLGALPEDLALEMSAAGVSDHAAYMTARQVAISFGAFSEQAVTDLHGAILLLINRSQRNGPDIARTSQTDEFWDRVWGLQQEGEFDKADELLAAELSKLSETEEAALREQIAIYDTGIQNDLLRRNPLAASQKVFKKLRLTSPEPAEFYEAIQTEQRAWFVRGQTTGMTVEISVAALLTEPLIARAPSDHLRGLSIRAKADALASLGHREADGRKRANALQLYDLALATLDRDEAPIEWARAQVGLCRALADAGQREDATSRLHQAVTSCRLALDRLDPNRDPTDWARAQDQLGTAQYSLAFREIGFQTWSEFDAAYDTTFRNIFSNGLTLNWDQMKKDFRRVLALTRGLDRGVARMDEAVAAYRAALAIRTPEDDRQSWAATSNNLANVLVSLGRLNRDPQQLEQALELYLAALQQWPRDRYPLRWSSIQHNTGLVLRELASHELGIQRLNDAKAAFELALQERSSERTPLDWASTLFSISGIELDLFDRTGNEIHLDRAEIHLGFARRVFERSDSSYLASMADARDDEVQSRRRK